MKPFRSIILANQSAEVLWIIMRDRMPEVATMLDDIESVSVLERRKTANGNVHLVNEWRAKPGPVLPIGSVIGQKSLAWRDHAEWVEAERRCSWRIHTLFLPDRIQCHGVTTYEPAMGGRGTRVTFEGEIDVDVSNLVTSTTILDRGIMVAVESVVTTLIPRNFRKTIEAAGRLLGRRS
jgi:hypothetical protein